MGKRHVALHSSKQLGIARAGLEEKYADHRNLYPFDCSHQKTGYQACQATVLLLEKLMIRATLELPLFWNLCLVPVSMNSPSWVKAFGLTFDLWICERVGVANFRRRSQQASGSQRLDSLTRGRLGKTFRRVHLESPPWLAVLVPHDKRPDRQHMMVNLKV